MKTLITLSAILFALNAFSSQAVINIYKWKDKDGSHRSINPPPPGTPYEVEQQVTQVRQGPIQGPPAPQNPPSPQFPPPVKVGTLGQNNQQGNQSGQWKPAPPPPQITKQDEENCRNYFESLGVNKQDASGLCYKFDVVKPLLSSRFTSCQQQISSITQNKVAELLCYEAVKNNLPDFSADELSCLSKSIQSVNKSFFFYEFAKGIYEKTKLYYVMKDCMNKSQATPAPRSNVSIINQFHYHTNTGNRVQKQSKMGGLSGIMWDSQINNYIAISDDQRFPFMVNIQWDIFNPQSPANIISDTPIQFPSDREYKKFDRFDLEDIVKLNSGNYVVSSEVDDSDSFQGGDSKKDKKRPQVPLYEISSKGDIIRAIPVAEDILPKSINVETQYDCTPPPPLPAWNEQNNNSQSQQDEGNFRFDTTVANQMGSDSQSSQTQSMTAQASTPPQAKAPPAPVQKKMCSYTQNHRDQGFDPNKGIEAIAYSNRTNELFYSSEAPLYQDRNKAEKEFVRIYRQTMNQEAATQAYARYPMTLEFDNGVSAMASVDENTLLVMERGFDSFKRQTHVNIYKVNWKDQDSNGFLKKKLIVRMNDLAASMPAGLRRFDNLEGMALGPQTPTHLSVVLVSDNNFSPDQMTQLIALQIPKDLLR